MHHGRVCESQPFLFLGKLAIVTEFIPYPYVCVSVCTVPRRCTYVRVTQGGGQTLCTHRGLARAGVGARQGNAPLQRLEKAHQPSRGAQEPRVGLTHPSPPPWFCLEGRLKLRVTFPRCTLAFGCFLRFLSQVLHVCRSHQQRRGQPTAFIHTPSKSFPAKRGPDDATSHSGSKTPSTTAASPQAIWKQLDCLSNN